jgi:hypothetical protein
MSDVKFKLIPALVFILVANPATYKLVRSVAGGWVSSPEGTAKIGGLILHSIVFILLVTFFMRIFPASSNEMHGGEVSSQGAYGMGTKLQDVPHMMAPAPYNP